MLNDIGPYILNHPEIVPFGETCFISRQPFREEHTYPKADPFGHMDVWHLVVPLGMVMVDPNDLSVNLTGVPFLSFYFYAKTLALEPEAHLTERIIEQKLRLIAREVTIVS